MDRRESRQKPFISVCIFTHNSAGNLPQAIKSAFSSGRRDFEIVVVDDGSTDDTEGVLRRLRLPNLRYVRTEHSGRPAARNRCIAEARGEYISWMGADDMYAPGILEHYAETAAAHPDVDVLYGNLVMADKRMRPVRELEYEDWRGRNQELLAAMVFRNSVPDGGSLIKKSMYDRFGGYDPDFPRAQDYEWFARIAGRAAFMHVGRNTAIWRILDAQLRYPGPKSNLGAKVVKRLLEQQPLEKMVPQAGWGRIPDNEAEAVARLLLAERFLYLKSPPDALEQVRKAVSLKPGEEILAAAGQLMQAIAQADAPPASEKATAAACPSG
ncbi:glycosyltransferase [Oceanidesulfovibrio indonesiensis]|nr:glycosyltransferase [Oceanidesulfovibrio indonesiensis]